MKQTIVTLCLIPVLLPLVVIATAFVLINNVVPEPIYEII